MLELVKACSRRVLLCVPLRSTLLNRLRQPLANAPSQGAIGPPTPARHQLLAVACKSAPGVYCWTEGHYSPNLQRTGQLSKSNQKDNGSLPAHPPVLAMSSARANSPNSMCSPAP
jgi:hypothetical protein